MNTIRPTRSRNIQWYQINENIILILPNNFFKKHYKHILPVGMIKVYLRNPILKLIWLNCDRNHTIDEIYKIVDQKFSKLDISPAYVRKAVVKLKERGLILLKTQ